MKEFNDDRIPQEIDPESGLPIGPLLAKPAPAKRPQRAVLDGRYCRLEPIDPVRHRLQLFEAFTPPDAARRFLYLRDPAVRSLEDMDAWLARVAESADPFVYAVIDRRTGRAEGRQSLMRIAPEHQCIEIGAIYWGPAISRTPAATEANFLTARYVFEELGYRRYEWKCDALNAASRRAAERFGFTFEGRFRRDIINKGRTRDTAWYSIIDEEWPSLKAAYESWLDPSNFDVEGRQRISLRELTAKALGRQ